MSDSPITTPPDFSDPENSSKPPARSKPRLGRRVVLSALRGFPALSEFLGLPPPPCDTFQSELSTEEHEPRGKGEASPLGAKLPSGERSLITHTTQGRKNRLKEEP